MSTARTSTLAHLRGSIERIETSGEAHALHKAALGHAGADAMLQGGLAKAAFLHLTESLAVDFAPHVTVNAVVPSQIASARTDRMPAYKAAAIAATPLGRLVTPPEIARMVALLCSPAFDFVTGRAIVLDGGRSIPVFPRLDLAAGAAPA